MKKIIPITFLVCFAFSLKAQTTIRKVPATTPEPPQYWAQHDQDYMNQSKYWFYRNRLKNEFMKVGPNQGESLPVGSLGIDRDNENVLIYNSVKTSDGMQCQGGLYIAILSMEYHLLKNSGQSTTSTIEELYYALKAQKRLDETAETYNFCFVTPNNHLPPQTQCTSPFGPSWNGFAIRDDIDCDPNSAISKYFQMKLSKDKINNKIEVTSGLCNNLYGKDTYNDIDGIGGQGKKNIGDVTNNDISHDQINYLFTGIAFVEKFIPLTESYNGENIVLLASQIAEKIFDHMGYGPTISVDNCYGLLKAFDDKCFDPLSNNAIKDIACASLGATLCDIPSLRTTRRFPWMIENPVTAQPSCISIAGACYGGFVSPGYSATAHKIIGKSYFISPLYYILWKDLVLGSETDILNMGKSGATEVNLILNQVAIGDSWNVCLLEKPCIEKKCIVKVLGKCIVSIPVPIPGSSCGCFGGVNLLETKKNLDKQSLLGHYETFALMHNVLYDKIGFYEPELYSFYNDIIDKAPCRGPYFYAANDKAVGGWASDNIIWAADGGNNDKWFTGNTDQPGFEYNGLDYMFLYNLNTIYNNKVFNDPLFSTTDKFITLYPNYNDNLHISNRTIHKGEYYNARSYINDLGIIKNGKTVVEKVTVSPKKGQNHEPVLDVRSGESIHLKPGVSIKSGSYAHFYLWQPDENWNWEMTISSSFYGNNRPHSPSGHRIATNNNPGVEKQPSEEGISSGTLEKASYLGDCIPNPAGSITTVPYFINTAGKAVFSISDICGKELLKSIDNEYLETGYHELGIDVSGFQPGVYFYTLEMPGFRASKKLVIVK